MFKLEKTSFGFQLILSGEVTIAEASQIGIEVDDILKSIEIPFSTIIDVRALIPLHFEVKSILNELEQRTREAGLKRRALIFHSPVIKNQALQLSHLSGTDNIQRQINAFEFEDWEQVAIDWIVNGIEPNDSLKGDITAKQSN